MQRPGLGQFDSSLMCIAYAGNCKMAYFFLVKRNDPVYSNHGRGESLRSSPPRATTILVGVNDPGLHQNCSTRLVWAGLGAGLRYSTRLKFDICCTTSSFSSTCVSVSLAFPLWFQHSFLSSHLRPGN